MRKLCLAAWPFYRADFDYLGSWRYTEVLREYNLLVSPKYKDDFDMKLKAFPRGGAKNPIIVLFM